MRKNHQRKNDNRTDTSTNSYSSYNLGSILKSALERKIPRKKIFTYSEFKTRFFLQKHPRQYKPYTRYEVRGVYTYPPLLRAQKRTLCSVPYIQSQTVLEWLHVSLLKVLYQTLHLCQVQWNQRSNHYPNPYLVC